jgi:hypothetical protein
MTIATARPDVPLTVCGALGTWLGIHALRAYLTMVVWNVAEDAPATQMGLVALSVWVVGPARLVAHARGRPGASHVGLRRAVRRPDRGAPGVAG